MPRTGLEPARLSPLAPETSASTIPPPGHISVCGCKDNGFFRDFLLFQFIFSRFLLLLGLNGFGKILRGGYRGMAPGGNGFAVVGWLSGQSPWREWLRGGGMVIGAKPLAETASRWGTGM